MGSPSFPALRPLPAVPPRGVEFDIQHAVHPHQVVGGGQRLPTGIFHSRGLPHQVIDHKHVVPAAALVGFKALGLVHQVKDAPNAAADVAHTLALVGVIGGKGGIQRAVNIAHGLCSQVVVLGIQVHLHHGLVPLLPEQAFQGRVLLHGPLVGTAQQNPVQRAAQPLGGPQFIWPPVLQVVPAQQHFHLCRLPDALRLAHHPAPAQGARHPLTLAGGCAPGKAVGQNGKHHAIVPQQMAGIPAKLGVQLPPHASEILEVDIIITDGQLRKIGFHSTLHRGHRSFPPQAAQVMVIR